MLTGFPMIKPFSNTGDMGLSIRIRIAVKCWDGPARRDLLTVASEGFKGYSSLKAAEQGSKET